MLIFFEKKCAMHSCALPICKVANHARLKHIAWSDSLLQARCFFGYVFYHSFRECCLLTDFVCKTTVPMNTKEHFPLLPLV